jgi:hypothetical protein
VTVVIGDAYRRFYNAHIRPGHERFARQLGCPLHVFTRPLRTTSQVDHPHASWEKVKIFEEPELASYEQLCWLDADLFVLGEPPDPFALTPDQGWLAVDDDTYGVPAQSELGRRWWYGFLPENAWPKVVLNTGLFVVHRKHQALLRAVLDHYGGRWDQGPLSAHLLAEPNGTLGPASLNRLVIHHLGTHGYGPASMRALVAEPGMLHFAAASAMRTPDYLAWAERASEGKGDDPRLVMRAQARALRYAVERPARHHVEIVLQSYPRLVRRVLAPALDARVERLGPALAQVAEWQAHVLDEALRKEPRLLLTRAQEAYPGWVTVDPITPMLSGTSNRKHGAHAGSVMVRLDALRALEERPTASLRGLVVLGVLEALPVEERVPFLRACMRVSTGEVQLLVADAQCEVPPSEPFSSLHARRHALSRVQLDALLDAANCAAEVRATGPQEVVITGLTPAPMRPPHAHWCITFNARG